ncbi:MAG: uroporphyrinogen decarboxylase [Myxococcota bacterium]|nr:uroporphyrinogen decarboxylase [Myxococcota bacterium]
MQERPLFIRACFGEETERTPIWLMRQAGRYMAEYRAIRAKADFWEVCHSPELATEVTLQPINAFGLDAAILFSDLLIPFPHMGFEVIFEPGVGPVLPNRIERPEDVDRLQPTPMREALACVGDAVASIVSELPKETPLIGFAGAPFTMASYLIEGGSSKQFMRSKAFLEQHPEAAERLFEKLCDAVIELLQLQIDRGCRAVQIFDSWAGALDPEGYARWGLPYTKKIVDAVRRPGVPVIVFAKGTGSYFDLVTQSGADVYGVDWTLSLDRARALASAPVALQGNLDPGRLLSPWDSLENATRRVLDSAGQGKGHVFNLGHGIYQHTPVDNVRRLVDFVQGQSHQWRSEG